MNKQTNKQQKKQTNKQTNKQTSKQASKPTNKQPNNQTCEQSYITCKQTKQSKWLKHTLNNNNKIWNLNQYQRKTLTLMAVEKT